MCFRYFVLISPWKRAWSFIWSNLNSLYPRMLCAKFAWNRPSGSGKEDFLILSMYFCYFVFTYISLWKGLGSSFEQFWISVTQGWLSFVPSLVEISAVVLEKKIFKFRQCVSLFNNYLNLEKSVGLWIPFTEGYFVPSLLDISPVVLEKKIFKFHQMSFRYFVIISPWKRACPFPWTNLNSFYRRLLCAKFGWNLPIGSWEEVLD